eukprot:g25750.t1
MLGSACCLSCQDVNALVRSVAVDAIVEVARDAEVMELAESMLALDPRFSVKLFGRAGQRVRLLELLASQDSELRQVVAEELTSSAQPGNHALLTCFLQLLRDPDREGFMNVRLLALRGLQKMSPLDDVLVEELPMHLRDRNMYICTAAIELLKSQQKSWVLAVLPQFLRSVPNPEVQASLLLLLGDLMSELTEDLAMVLSEILGGNEPALQRSAALLLMPYVTRDGLEQEGLERRLRGEGWTQACREVWRSSADWFQQNSEHKLSRKIPEGLQEPIWSQRTADSQLQLRFDSVEAPLSLSNSSRLEKELPGVKYLFPLVDCWEELQEALSDLHVRALMKRGATWKSRWICQLSWRPLKRWLLRCEALQ